mmetsp:Transcript_18110/g.15804  ORF Transcript_18110/g.15804 Transcript_18110/m.15804 type:complete len:125 (+) Transcript_18110:117-491(+)
MFGAEFFRRADNHIVGLKFPNLFGILIYDNRFISGYLREEPIELEDRLDVLMMTNSNHAVLNYRVSPLFLDNFGTQLCVYILAFVIIALLHPIKVVYIKKEEDAAKLNRIFRWNFLLSNFIGSY